MNKIFLSRAWLLGAACLLASCGPNIPKADALEAASDQAMGVGAYPVAIDELTKALKYDGDEPRRWVKLGRAQRAANMPAMSAQSFQHALDLDPANVEALQNMSILAVRSGHYDDARSYVDPLMSLSPDDIAGTLALGAIALYQKHLTEALGYANKLIKIAPSSVGGYSLKAHVLDAAGRPAEAAQVLAQQMVFNPDDQGLALQLLEAYRHAGDIQGVRDTAITLARLIPDDPRYQMEAARAVHARGEKDKADRIVDGLVKRYPYLPEISLAAAQFWQATLPADAAMARVGALTANSSGRTKAALCDLLIRAGRAQQVATMLAPLDQAEISTANAEVVGIYSSALLAMAQADRAKLVADKVLAFDGQIESALLVRAKILLARRRFADALSDAQVAATGNGDNAEAAVMVARIYTAMGNDVLAARAWGDAQARRPDDVGILRERVNWLLAKGQSDVAKGLTTAFSIGHWQNPQVWLLHRQVCTAANDDECVKRANVALTRLGAKQKGAV